MDTHIFRDFDAFASSVRDVDCVMLLQNPKRRRWVISLLDLPDVHVQLERSGSGNIVEGQSRSDGYVLYMPLTDACEYSANGTVLRKDSFMVLEPGCEFCVSTKAEHDWCSMFVPSHKFARGDREKKSPGSDKMGCRVTHPNREVARQFRALVRQLMTAAADCPKFESSPAATWASEELLKVASLVIGQRQAGNPNQEGRPRLARQEIIRRSKALLEERDGKAVLLEELAAAAGVSERTLRTIFNEYFGVGPARYLQLRQLHQVHRALRAADPEAVSVREVLARYGERQVGRFASRYRRLFGELPSETLRRKRR